MNYKKSMAVTMLFFAFLHNYFSQSKNWVFNPSFELVDNCACPDSMYPIGWKLFSGLNNLYSYHACCIDSTKLSTPKNIAGFQFPKQGLGYGIMPPMCNPYSNNCRGYIQSKLIKKLKSKKYHIYIYIYLAEISTVASSNIQIAFTDNIITVNSFAGLITFPSNSGIPQVKNSFFNTILDSTNWLKISGVFKAKGTENYITIGNFYDNTQTDTFPIKFGSTGWPNNTLSFYYVDDIHLTEEDRAEAYFDTSKTSLCIKQGMPKQLGDTAQRPWLRYEWRDAAGQVVGNARNYTYNAANLGQTFFTVSISDTAEDAFITKAIDTVYIDVSLSPDTVNCNAVYIDEVLRDAEQIDLYYADHKIIFKALPERFTTNAGRSSEVETYLQLKSIDGKMIFKTKLQRSVSSGEVEKLYALNKELEKGFYVVEVVYQGQNIKRKKLCID